MKPGQATSLKSLLLAVSLLSAGHACTCFSLANLPERREKMGTAFVGRLTGMSLDTTRYVVKLEFAVDSVWNRGKVERRKRVELETNWGSGACGFEMNLGERALVFAYPEKRGLRKVLVTDLCARNLVDPGPEHLDSLWSKARVGTEKRKPR